VRNGTILTETTTTFGIFAAHKVTGTRLVVAELTGAGLFQTLCGTLSGFEFRHCLHPLFLMFIHRQGQCFTLFRRGFK
jgi:hypothetical protein